MNQILSTGSNNNYNNSDTKKIIIFFSIAVILLAMIIIAVAISSMKKDDKQLLIPNIELVKNVDEKQVTIKASCEDGINLLIYSWNNESENRVNLDGKTSFERIIDIPINAVNKLTVEVRTVNGMSAQKEEEILLDVDANKPSIEEMAIVNSKLHIKAVDNKKIEYLAYKWEDEDEVKVYPEEDDETTVEVDVDIKRGTYKFTVKVIDDSGNKEEVSKLITGVNEPEIGVLKHGKYVRVTVTHDRGFKQIEYLINDELYVYDEAYGEYSKDKTTVELNFPLQEGENIVQVKAYSLERLSPKEDDQEDKIEDYASKKFIGKCTYETEE